MITNEGLALQLEVLVPQIRGKAKEHTEVDLGPYKLDYQVNVKKIHFYIYLKNL